MWGSGRVCTRIQSRIQYELFVGLVVCAFLVCLWLLTWFGIGVGGFVIEGGESTSAVPGWARLGG